MADRSPIVLGKQGAVSDDQVKALLDDLDSSMTHFDERLRAYEAEHSAVPGVRHSMATPFPNINLEVQQTLPPLQKVYARGASPDVARPTSIPEADLLTELARSAEEHAKIRKLESRSQQENEQRLDLVLRAIFDYLHQFTQHVNVIKPAIPLTYILDNRHRFGALQWHEGFAEYRTRSKSEIALVESVSVRLRYSTAALKMTQTSEKLNALRHEFHLFNLTIKDETKVDIPGQGSGVRFTLVGSIPVQLNFRSDGSSGKIIVRGRNIGSLGLSAYLIEADRVSRASLNAVGLNLLGRSTHLPGEFTPIAFSTKE